ncbi:hypothetical protein Syun_028473 [Stephania yunnanensis]|uniref:DNA mismatch repair protein n=1 Tax=Stephania yunnanensis TaxID=152371 RepID=A0AAP0EKU1_9MAGN
MAPSRRNSNGRSPLVNQQRQITSFFTKATTTPPPPPPPSSSITPLNPNPNPSPSPSPNSTTPSTSSSESKRKKAVLVIGPTQEGGSPKTPEPAAKRAYGEEVVGRRVRVYWPLDESWYEGVVKVFDEFSGKHLVQYDDAEEERLELGRERIEWVEEAVTSFKRLKRKMSGQKDRVLKDLKGEDDEDGNEGGRGRRRSVSKKMVVMEEEEGKEENAVEEESGRDGDDDSGDEDWGSKMEKESVDEDSEEMDLEEEEEEEKGEDSPASSKKASKRSLGSRKRKSLSEEKPGLVKKNKSSGNGKEGKLKISHDVSGCLTQPINSMLTSDATERFGAREAEKFWFLGVERRDAKKRSPGDVDFDPRTLYLPPDFLKSLTGGQRQWWEFKSKHMDKVLFFKMGKFYELFEMDAHIAAKELGLQYMKGEQPHCGFPEKNFAINLEKLARKGFRVLVVEQTETPEQLDARRKEMGTKDKVVKREICAIVTKGTLTEGEVLASCPDTSYILALTESFEVVENQLVIGVCVVDVSTSRFMVGQFSDDSDRTLLCSLLSELRPVEIIKPARVLCPESEKALLRHTRNPLVNDLVPIMEFWDADRTVDEVKKFYGHLKGQSVSGSLKNVVSGDLISSSPEKGLKCFPDVLSELVRLGKHGATALSAFGGCLFYLRQAFLDETLLRYAKFELLPHLGHHDITQKPYMVLDSAAIENLEILENNKNGGSSGTLYEQLNHCVTAFGKRLLKSWFARPLFHTVLIRERQDAVAALKGKALPSVLEFRKQLVKLPDMERLLARLFASSEANGRNANKVVLYEDASKKHIQEFVTALYGCELMVRACSSFSAITKDVESSLLYRLLTPGQGLPDMSSVISHFKDAFDWTEAESSGRIIPREGADADYDSACKTLREVESSLEKHLKEQRKVLGESSITYVTVGKDVYLLEVPESLRGSIPRDYELRSSKKGFSRYWTPQIKKLLGELSLAEAEKEASLKSILQRMIGSFCDHHLKWRHLVSGISELDVLISLAIASDYYEGPSCRPTILEAPSSSEVPRLSAKALGHPVLRSDALGRGTFVPNDVSIGGSHHASFILLTGPNMGGKSTLIRQICMCVILAQLGADVPAEEFELSPVDQIFVRMGARDHIMAGQSTFLTELKETASMLSSATRHSLVALDELGRGTSTSDGQAIAESVLEHFVRKINCRGLFSTHYHRLAVDYQNDSQVSLRHMACQVGKGASGVEEVTFLYRLTPGACPKSYGVNVARLAGLPESILQKATIKSREFEAVYGRRREGSKVKPHDNRLDKTFAIIIQDLGLVAMVLDCLLKFRAGQDCFCKKPRLVIEIWKWARLKIVEHTNFA